MYTREKIEQDHFSNNFFLYGKKEGVCLQGMLAYTKSVGVGFVIHPLNSCSVKF